MKYDVFISYSRKDYVNEHGEVISNSPVKSIIDFLDKEGISYWFDKDGIYSGREFVEVIANAIVDSKMMIFVSSNNSNNSLYTTGEIFEAIENKKLIIPVRIDDSQYNAKFKLLIRPLDYIDYTKVDALSDLLRAINKEKDIISEREEAEKKKRKEIEKRESKKLIKSEIEECVQEVHKLMSTRQLLVDRIYKKLRDIDVTQKVCPICGSKSNVENEYCQTCGWYFVGLSCIEDFDEKINQSLLVIARSRWEKIEELQTCIVDLKEQIRVLESKSELLEVGAKNVCNSSNDDNIPSFKSCFLRHNILTSLVLIISSVYYFVLGIGLLVNGVGHSSRYHLVVMGVFLLFMSLCNYLILKFDRAIWIMAPIISYAIGCIRLMKMVGFDSRLVLLGCCLLNLFLMAVLFFLKKGGKNSYWYLL
jgi:hypothetical protein